MSNGWQPDHRIGTWHPCGRGLGPVRYEQRVNGKATGMFFVVSRRRYWLICALVAAIGLPVVGPLAQRALRRMIVDYQWVWLHHGPRGVA